MIFKSIREKLIFYSKSASGCVIPGSHHIRKIEKILIFSIEILGHVDASLGLKTSLEAVLDHWETIYD